jgi:hypothetical protein
MKVIGKVYLLMEASTHRVVHMVWNAKEPSPTGEMQLGPVFHDLEQAVDVAKAYSQAFQQEIVVWEMDESNEVFVLNPELLDSIKVRGKIVVRVLEERLVD